MSSLHQGFIRKRRTVLKSRDDNIIRTLNYQDSDGELSPHDVDSPTCGNMCMSPRRISKQMEVQSEFTDFGCVSPSPLRMRPSRFVNRTRNSPIPFGLDEGNDGDIDDDEQRVPTPMSDRPTCPDSVSPPHRSLRALRLFDTPHTPKSLLQRARRRRLTAASAEKEKYSDVVKKTPPQEPKVEANFNPFTPNNNRPLSHVHSATNKRNRSQMERSLLEDSAEDEIEFDMPSTKKIALHEINTSRYNEEFHEQRKLGDGEFGSVYKCVHRLDGCTYAIKKSKTPVAGSVYERNAMNEVYAHAVLGKHQHVVRYYSAWAEDDHMYIQNEFCNGGSIAEDLDENKRTGRVVSEDDMKTILHQVSKGLKYIHSQNLVHLDIKPENIFIHRNPKFLHSPESGMESCEDEEEEEEEIAIIYKLGDLGHVTSVSKPTVEEGDCRYLPNEILREEFQHLTKCDVFSLGMTIYEAGLGRELPKNGPEWHAIRNGVLPPLSHVSDQFNALLKNMVHPDPLCRPSAAAVMSNPLLCPQAKKSKAQLRHELNQERFKNEMLAQKLIEATKCLTSAAPLTKTRLIGARMKRSMSMGTF